MKYFGHICSSKLTIIPIFVNLIRFIVLSVIIYFLSFRILVIALNEKRPAASATDLLLYHDSIYMRLVPYDLMSCKERHHQYVFTIIVLMTFVVITAANICIL